MTNTITAFVIDSKNCTVREEQIESGDIAKINKLIGSDIFTGVYSRNENLPSLYVDDEGMWSDEPYMFMYNGVIDPLIGNAVAMGCDDEGKSISPKITLEEFRRNVQFVNVYKVGGRLKIERRG